MNIIEFLIDMLPISSALLSVVASIAAAALTKRITKSRESIDNQISKISIKWKDKEIDINDCSEKEIMELITKLKDEEALQKDSACKKESWIVAWAGTKLRKLADNSVSFYIYYRKSPFCVGWGKGG